MDSSCCSSTSYPFLDTRIQPDKFHEYAGRYDKEDNVLVIDNGKAVERNPFFFKVSPDLVSSRAGSHNLRLGWHRDPSVPSLCYKPLLAKTRRERRGKAARESELLVGNDLLSSEAASSLGRLNLRTPFDRNVVTQLGAMETLLDYGLAHLGLDEGGRVAHPIVMTEAPANPSTSRACKTWRTKNSRRSRGSKCCPISVRFCSCMYT